MKITIDVLKGLARAAAKSEVSRYALGGVHVCATGGKLFAEATNGRLALRVDCGKDEDAPDSSAIYDAKGITGVKAPKGRAVDVGERVADYPVQKLDGQFPNVEQFLHAPKGGMRIKFRADQLKILADALLTIGQDECVEMVIPPCGKNAVYLESRNINGVIMPVV